LVVMTFILTSQIPAQTKKYINITEEVEKDVTKDIKTRNVCEELFSNRRCLPLETCNAQGLINMGTDWRDCQQKATQGHTLYCCK
ncbi:hypothetical protein JW851_01720, partial [Candidatus Woesearchaeota archaeon]|nr:hypothetical protein [Candidatus Woesearchaeota archaeon]